MSAESPLLATGLPSANTVLDPLLIFAECPIHRSGQQTSIVCGSNLSPGLNTAEPFMNTLLAVALHPIDVVQACPVLALSILSLATAGMPVFIAVGNRSYYSLNLVLAGELSAWGGFFFQAINTELTFGALVVFSLIAGLL